MNGMITPGIKSEPSINNILTTDGIKIERKIDKIATMISPFFIKKTGFFLESFFLTSILCLFQLLWHSQNS